MAIWALKGQNFEKVCKIKIKIRAILHTISKAHMHWLLDGGAILLLKKCSDIKLSPGISSSSTTHVCFVRLSVCLSVCVYVCMYVCM